MTSFPHLHFLVLHEGRAIDPFSGWPAGSGCGGYRAERQTCGQWLTVIETAGTAAVF